ncbi:Transposon Tf2-9 polyprotein [Thelohanellus kitauei]|uniref:Transposon Tf2-9 polyprotein n=1 Tax=Thelohanellus kitauei TaxID=669202 RepID=A0A0C2N751_THEKT|nr:Transposon Tf2-9 polyprotein [Thelohanellus kitauei]
MMYHLKTLELILAKLQKNGLSWKIQKCEFFKAEITYLDQVLCKATVSPSPANLGAICKLREPRNPSELKCFLGKATFCCKFNKNFLTICEPLNRLLKKDAEFIWRKDQAQAFNIIKRSLVETTQLTKFDPDSPLILSTDASPLGVGAVLLHKMPDGSERPIAHASKTLNKHQWKYSQLEREGLAAIFGLTKFH